MQPILFTVCGKTPSVVSKMNLHMSILKSYPIEFNVKACQLLKELCPTFFHSMSNHLSYVSKMKSHMSNLNSYPIETYVKTCQL